MISPRFLPFLALFVPTLPALAVDFSHEIVPILRAHCTECHAGDKKKGGFSINTRADLLAGSENGKTVLEGDSAHSLMIENVVTTDPDKQMPPKGERLSAAEVAKLKEWIDAKLPWPEGFAFKPPAYEPPLKPRRPVLPAAVAGLENPVDRIIGAYLEKNKLPAPAPLGDGVFYRRLHLDLTGLLPAPDKLAAFLAEPAQDKRARAITELLTDNRGYAEHWLTFWNDLLRNDYAGTGYIDGGRKGITPWLYQALLENKPYNQFVSELIAPPSADSEGFSKGIKWRGEVSAAQKVPIQFSQNIAQAFLGINLKCASCHDSFIDRWKLDEAYALAAVFSPEPLELHRCDKPTGRQAKAAWLFPELGQIDAAQPPAERLKQLAALMTHPENGRLTRTVVNRLWHRLMGRGIVHPVDAMQTEPWSADLLDFLATDFADHRYDLKQTLALICNSRAYQSVAETTRDGDEKKYIYAGPRAKRLTAEQFTDAVWQITGTAPKKFDAPVKRGGAGASASPAAGTDKLSALWIWSNDQKAAQSPAGEAVSFRITVNVPGPAKRAVAAITCDNSFRLWLNGKELPGSDNWEAPVAVDLMPALKAGANDLVIVGVNGGKGPNWAGLFVEGRIILADGTVQPLVSNAAWYWTSSAPNASGAFAPGDHHWKPAVVLDGAIWGKVGEPVLAALAEGLNGSGGDNSAMVRASLLKNDGLMAVLGRPNREQIVSTRPSDLTTLEAMALNNGQILTTRLEQGAAALLKSRDWPDSAALVQWLYAFAYSRAPSPPELALALEALGGAKPTAAGLQDLLWALLVQPEFELVR